MSTLGEGSQNHVAQMESPPAWMWVVLVLMPYIGFWFFLSKKLSAWRAESLLWKIVRFIYAVALVLVVAAIIKLATMSPEEWAEMEAAREAKKEAAREAEEAKLAASRVNAEKIETFCKTIDEYESKHSEANRINEIKASQVYTNFQEWGQDQLIYKGANFKELHASNIKIDTNVGGGKAKLSVSISPCIYASQTRIAKGTDLYKQLADISEGSNVVMTGTIECDLPGQVFAVTEGFGTRNCELSLETIQAE